MSTSELKKGTEIVIFETNPTLRNEGLIQKYFWAAVNKWNTHSKRNRDPEVIVKLSQGVEGHRDVIF